MQHWVQQVMHRRVILTLSIILSAVFLFWVGGPAHASIFGSAPPVPDWVKTARQQTLQDFPGSPKAVVLLDETTYTVGVDGRATKHVRYVVKILRPQGRDYGYPVVWFDKDSKVLAMHVWSIDPAGHEYSMRDDEIKEFSPPGEGGELYVDDKAKVADPPGRDPGGVIAYESGLTWRKPTGDFRTTSRTFIRVLRLCCRRITPTPPHGHTTRRSMGRI
jgi:hypothetical protein